MAKQTCAGGCGRVRDLEVFQKGAKDVGFTTAPKFWICEDCKERQAPPTAVESRPRPLPQSVDPAVTFTFVPPDRPAAQPAPSQPAPEAKPAGAEDPKA